METTPQFMQTLDNFLRPGAYVFAGFAVIILLYHEFRILQIRDYKAKYDYVNLHEVRYFWYAVMSLIIAVALYMNWIGAEFSTDIFGSLETWFYVRTFMTMCFIVVSYFIFYSVVRIYYPRFVEKRLMKLRNKPRVSPAGNLMRKLTAAEEEAHLEETQFTEQSEVHSIDYDVWLDEKTGFKKIEKYESYQHAIECSECGYVTMRISQEEITQVPSPTEAGVLVKHYKCSYCGHREAKAVAVAKLSENIA